VVIVVVGGRKQFLSADGRTGLGGDSERRRGIIQYAQVKRRTFSGEIEKVKAPVSTKHTNPRTFRVPANDDRLRVNTNVPGLFKRDPYVTIISGK